MQSNSTPALRLFGVRRRTILAAAAAAVTVACGADGFAQTVPPPTARENTWIGPVAPTGGDWLDPLHWSYDDDGDALTPGLNVVPSTTANHFATIDNNGLAVVTGAAEAAFLTLGTTYRAAGDVDTGSLRIETGAALNLGEFRVGGRESLESLSGLVGDYNDGGIGSVLQTGGTVNVTYTHGEASPGVNYEPPIQSMYIGDGGNDLKATPGDNHSDGTYHITGGTIVSGIANNDGLVIGTGVGTKGTFIQEGGDVTSTGFIIVGRRGATATYTMSGGTLRSNGLVGLSVGDGEAAGVTATHGTFTQTAGDVTTSADVAIGRRSGTGIYNMSGGTMNIATEATAAGGSLVIGGFSQTVVAQMHSVGTLNLSGSAQITIGRTTDTSGSFGNMNVGFTSGSLSGGTNTGLLDMDGGSITFNRPGAIFAVGNGRGATGTVDQSGGTITITGASSGMSVGRNGSSATYNLSGTGVINARQIVLQASSPEGTPVRQFNVTGGTLNVTTFNIQNATSTSIRSLNISGGSVNITGTLTTGSNNATVNITGGDVSINSLSLSSTSTFHTAVPALSIPGSVALGNATVQVDSGELTFAGTISSPAGGRTLTKTGAGTLTINAAATFNPNTVFANNGGTWNINTQPVNAGTTTGPTLSVNANAGNTNFGGTIDYDLAQIDVAAGAVATVTPDGNRLLKSRAVNVSAGGKLDMTDNDMIVDYVAGSSPEFTLRDQVLLFRDGTGTEGIGFTETVEEDVILAFGEAAELGITDFSGFAVDADTVVGKYTYYGDANFDGQVTTDDYVAVDLGLGTGDSWVQGDFDLNGVVTTDDYVVVDLNLGKGTSNPLAYAEEQAAMIALHTEMFGQSYVDKLAYASEFGWVAASVPEPGALSLLGLGAMATLRRRRRRR